MRIVLVASSYPANRRSAGEPSYTAILQELARRGYEVDALAGAESGRSAREMVGGVHVHRELATVADDEIRGGVVGRQCRALAARLRGDPAALFFADAGGLPAALLGVPGAAATWVDLGYDWPLTAYGASHPWWTHARSLRGMARLSARALGAAIEPPDVGRSRFVVWCRERWQALLSQGLPVQGAHVLSPGIDTQLFAFRSREPASAGLRLHVHGRLTRDGGIGAVFLALQRLPESVRVRIVAESTEASYLAELGELGRAAGVMDRVEVAPAAGEPQRLALLREADVFVQPQEAGDPFPRCALEAAAAGVPVVCARPAGEGAPWPWARGTVEEFPAGNPRALAKVLRAHVEGGLDAERLARARRLVEARYAVTYAVDQLEPLIA